MKVFELLVGLMRDSSQSLILRQAAVQSLLDDGDEDLNAHIFDEVMQQLAYFLLDDDTSNWEVHHYVISALRVIAESGVTSGVGSHM